MGSRRVSGTRREELLDGLMEVMIGRGFATLKIKDLASELGCSISSLYAIAPSKESLVASAFSRWAVECRKRAHAAAAKAHGAGEKARAYYWACVDESVSLSPQLRADLWRFESTRQIAERVSDESVSDVAAYLETAIRAGEVRNVDPMLISAVLRQVARFIDTPEGLEIVGADRERAIHDIDVMIWDGLLGK